MALDRLKGIQVAQLASSISHLLFVDLCYVYCNASLEFAAAIVELLHTFQLASGQEINTDKSYVFFSSKQILCDKILFMF